MMLTIMNLTEPSKDVTDQIEPKKPDRILSLKQD